MTYTLLEQATFDLIFHNFSPEFIKGEMVRPSMGDIVGFLVDERDVGCLDAECMDAIRAGRKAAEELWRLNGEDTLDTLMTEFEMDELDGLHDV